MEGMNQDVKMWGSFLHCAKCSHTLINVFARGEKQIIIFLIGYWFCILGECQQNFASLLHVKTTSEGCGLCVVSLEICLKNCMRVRH